MSEHRDPTFWYEYGADRLRAEGWTVIPFDEPERAMRGFMAIKSGCEDRCASWPMFEGGEYRTDTALVSAAHLANFVEGGGTLLCDDPMKRRIGFVRYQHDALTAIVRQCTLTMLKKASASDKNVIMAARRHHA